MMRFILALFSTFVRRLRLLGVRAQICLGIVPKTAPLPDGPAGFTGWALYINKEDRTMGMLVWKMSTGELIRVNPARDASQSWNPGSEWEFSKEVSRTG